MLVLNTVATSSQAGGAKNNFLFTKKLTNMDISHLSVQLSPPTESKAAIWQINELHYIELY